MSGSSALWKVLEERKIRRLVFVRRGVEEGTRHDGDGRGSGSDTLGCSDEKGSLCPEDLT